MSHREHGMLDIGMNCFPFLDLWDELNLCKMYHIRIIEIISKLSPAKSRKVRVHVTNKITC